MLHKKYSQCFGGSIEKKKLIHHKTTMQPTDHPGPKGFWKSDMPMLLLAMFLLIACLVFAGYAYWLEERHNVLVNDYNECLEKQRNPFSQSRYNTVTLQPVHEASDLDWIKKPIS